MSQWYFGQDKLSSRYFGRYKLSLRHFDPAKMLRRYFVPLQNVAATFCTAIMTFCPSQNVVEAFCPGQNIVTIICPGQNVAATICTGQKVVATFCPGTKCRCNILYRFGFTTTPRAPPMALVFTKGVCNIRIRWGDVWGDWVGLWEVLAASFQREGVQLGRHSADALLPQPSPENKLKKNVSQVHVSTKHRFN